METHIMYRTRSILWLSALVQLLAVVGRQPSVAAQVRGSASITIEAESLVGSAQVTHGKLMPQNMQPFGSGWSGGSQLFWAGAQLGAELRLAFSTDVTGRYEIFLHFTRAPDYALVRASFDGAPWVTFNGYAANVSRDRALVAMRDLTPGPHELLLKVTNKDGPSQGLNVGIDRIELAALSAAATGNSSQNPSTLRNPAGSMTQAAGASMVEGGPLPVPVLRIPPAARIPLQTMTRGVEPLSAAERVSIMERATSRQLKGSPGQTLRVTASQPRILNKASIYLLTGSFEPTDSTDGAIRLYPDSTAGLLYRQVEPDQPHLLDCGVSLGAPGEIKLSADLFGKTTAMQLYKVSMPKGEQRLLVVLVPADTHMWVVIQPGGSTTFSIRYCELTPGK
jgi:hypothetical protein